MRVAGDRRSVGVACATMTVIALAGGVDSAWAGGASLRTQSSEHQGTSFSGTASGTSIGAIFWNPAATANKEGINTETSVSLIVPRGDVTIDAVDTSGLSPDPILNGGASLLFGAAGDRSGDIAIPSLAAASYGTYQLSDKAFVGIAITSPFGAKSKPDNLDYDGSVLAQTTTLLTVNANPTFAYRIAPGVTIGVGAQLQYGEGKLSFATITPLAGLPTPFASDGLTVVTGDGWAFGATAGVLLEPADGTRIGVGYRSRLDQEINGHVSTDGGYVQKSDVTLHLPDVLTLSISQAITPSLRASASFEWERWSRFKEIAATAAENGVNAFGPTAAGQTILAIPLNWDDGYFFAAGIEYDVSSALTVRTGIGYEISPVQSAEQRSPAFPDADRFLISGGLTWKMSSATSLDLAYTHVFIRDGDVERTSVTNISLSGSAEASADVVSVGIKTKW